jgi:hypothetical protein
MAFLASLGVIESPYRRLSTPNPPEVLRQKAREVIANLGYTDAPADHAAGFAYDVDFLNYAVANDRPNPLWERILVERPVPLYFWYRQSPSKMFADGFTDTAFTPDVVNYDDPPATLSGMVNLQLDPQGRLVAFQAIPPQRQDHPQPVRIPDWTPLFLAAGIDLSTLRTSEPH